MVGKLPFTYKKDFDPKMGEKQKVFMTSTVTTAGGIEKLHTTSREVRVFNGKSVEELCFTRECFNQAADDISIKSKHLTKEFVKILAPTPRTKFDKMIQTELGG